MMSGYVLLVIRQSVMVCIIQNFVQMCTAQLYVSVIQWVQVCLSGSPHCQLAQLSHGEASRKGTHYLL